MVVGGEGDREGSRQCVSDGGSRQDADKTSSDENVSRLGTKIAGHDIYWVSQGGGGPCVHLSRSNVKRAGD